jgi:hypothetical protein
MDKAAKYRLDVFGLVVQKAYDDLETANFTQNVEKPADSPRQRGSVQLDPLRWLKILIFVVDDVVQERVYQRLCQCRKMRI